MQLACCKKLALMSHGGVYNDPFLIAASGIVPQLVLLLDSQNLHVQYFALRTLANLVKYEPGGFERLTKTKAIPKLIKFLDSNELELVEQATWALSVIESSEFRQIILEMGILSKIEKYVTELTQLNFTSISKKLCYYMIILHNITQMVEVLCSGHGYVFKQWKKAFAILLQLSKMNCSGVTVNLMYAYVWVTENPSLDQKNITYHIMKQNDLLSKFIKCLYSSNWCCKSATIRMLKNVGKFLTNDDKKNLVELGILAALDHFLKQQKEKWNVPDQDIMVVLSYFEDC